MSETKPVEQAKAEIPLAEPGPPAKVSARFAIRHDVTLALGIETIRAAVQDAQFDIRNAISQSVGRAYRASGLRMRTHNLINWATTQYRLRVQGSASSIFIDAAWDEQGYAAKYWKAQLWGVARGYSAKRPNMHLTARKFIFIDPRCVATIERIVNRAIAGAIKGAAKEETPKPSVAPVLTMIRRPSPFKQRQFIRATSPRGLGLPRDQARRLVASQILSNKKLSAEMVIQANLILTQGFRQADFAKVISALQSQMKMAPV